MLKFIRVILVCGVFTMMSAFSGLADDDPWRDKIKSEPIIVTCTNPTNATMNVSIKKLNMPNAGVRTGAELKPGKGITWMNSFAIDDIYEIKWTTPIEGNIMHVWAFTVQKGWVYIISTPTGTRVDFVTPDAEIEFVDGTKYFKGE